MPHSLAGYADCFLNTTHRGKFLEEDRAKNNINFVETMHLVAHAHAFVETLSKKRTLVKVGTVYLPVRLVVADV